MGRCVSSLGKLQHTITIRRGQPTCYECPSSPYHLHHQRLGSRLNPLLSRVVSDRMQQLNMCQDSLEAVNKWRASKFHLTSTNIDMPVKNELETVKRNKAPRAQEQRYICTWKQAAGRLGHPGSSYSFSAASRQRRGAERKVCRFHHRAS